MTGETVVVTGGASGIGRAAVRACAARRWQVAVLDVDAGAAAAVADEAAGLGAPAAVALGCDVAVERDVERAMADCVDRLGVPTGVFANAGIEVNAAAHELPLADWHRVLEINLTGVFLTARHGVRVMLDAGRGGSVVCTSSPAAFIGHAGGGNGAYAASKGGISALVRSLAIDYARDGIRVNAVVPGATDTPLLGADRDTLGERAKAQIPLGRLADPAEIAAAVVWLLSPESSYVTGSHLVCDGGLMAKSANTF